MRFLTKYKIHEHFASAPRKLPTRVAKFKKSKWSSIIRKLWKRKWVYNSNRTSRTKYIKPEAFTDFSKVNIPKKKQYLRNAYKLKLQTKKYILSLYDNSIKIRLNHKIKSKRELFCFHYMKSLFRIDILLWYLFFFTSSAEARLFLNSRGILVNNRPVKSNYFIKRGDIISLESFSEYIEEKNSYFNIAIKFKRYRVFFPFLEYDYYTNSIIVLKDWNELSFNDITVMVFENKRIKPMLYK